MHRVVFDKNFKPSDLLNGVEFEVDNEKNESDDEFYDERFDGYKNAHEECNIQITENNMPFSEMKSNMISVTEDGLIRKQVLKQGVGTKIPDKAVVIMHYDAFLDTEKDPFDSTRLRNRPHKFLIGDGNIVPGLELGIQTMKKEEIARILISPEYGYREMGCPPRIPGDAEILYVVEIIHFYDSKDAIEFEEMTTDEQKKAAFEKVVSVFHCEHERANDLFRRKHYKPAIACYRKMLRLLEEVSVKNEQEDNQRNRYLLKLYLNLCLCYINIRESDKAIIYGKLALGLDNKHPKALYRLGCAFLLNHQYDLAKHYLLKAKEHTPFQSCIQKVLIELESKRKAHRQWELEFSGRIFGNKDPVKVSESSTSAEISDFEGVIEEQLKKLKESEEKELSFSAGYLDWQIDIVKKLAKAYDLAFVTKTHDKKIIKVVKK